MLYQARKGNNMFKSKAELGGEIDSRIWKGGPVNPNKKGQSRRAQVQSELSSLVRKFRPLQADAIKQAMRVLNSPETADANTLRASALILQTYQSLLKDLNNLGEDETETVEQLIEAPKFQLHMLKQEDK